MALHIKSLVKLVILAFLVTSTCGMSPHKTRCLTKQRCVQEFDDLYTCHPTRKVCVRIGWEWSFEDILGFIFTFLLLMYNASGGVGSMTLLIPIYIGLFGFYSGDAFKLARYTNLIASLVNLGLNWNRIDPKKQMLAVNYKVATVIIPLHLAGADIGLLLGNYFSPFICLMLLIGLLAKSLYDSWTRGMQEYRKEKGKSADQLLPEKNTKDVEISTKSKAHEALFVENESDLVPAGNSANNLTDHKATILVELTTPSLLNPPAQSSPSTEQPPKARLVYAPFGLNEQVREEFGNMGLLGLSLLVVLFSVLVRGSEQLPSVFGFEECTPQTWATQAVTQVMLVGLAVLGYRINRRTPPEILAKSDSNLVFSDPRLRWKILLAGYLSGTFSGIVGVGGGLLYTLYLLSLGFGLSAVGSITMLSVVCSSIVTSLQTYLSKGVSVEHSYLLLGITLVASLVGYLYVKVWVFNLNKLSIRIFMIFAVVAICSLVVPYTTVASMLEHPGLNFEFGDFC